PPVSDLSSAFLSPKSPLHLQFAYFQASLVVEYLVESFGLNALRGVLKDLGDGLQIDDAMVRRFAPLSRIDRQFAEFAQRRAERFGSELTWEDVDLPIDADVEVVAAWLTDRPRSFAGLVRLAQTMQRSQQWEASLEPARRVRELLPDYVGDGNAYQLLARAHRELGDARAEREALESWARRAGDAADVYLRLIELAEGEQDWQAVSTNARRLLAVNPLIVAPHRSLASAAAELGALDDAVRAQRALLQFETSDPVAAHYQLASLLRQQGESAAARRHVLMALEEAPRFIEAHRLLLDLANVSSSGPTSSDGAETTAAEPAAASFAAQTSGSVENASLMQQPADSQRPDPLQPDPLQPDPLRPDQLPPVEDAEVKPDGDRQGQPGEHSP
ncbi:MAG: hypothetical protein AAF961_13655, partial [Planctomycetota bacterium]